MFADNIYTNYEDNTSVDEGETPISGNTLQTSKARTTTHCYTLLNGMVSEAHIILWRYCMEMVFLDEPMDRRTAP